MADQLLALLKRARQRSIKQEDCYRLQRDLVAEIIKIERFIRKCSDRLAKVSATKGAAEKVTELRGLRSDLEWHRASLRLVGDTLVYRFIPPHLVRRMFNASDPGWLLGKKGTKFELMSVRDLARKGEFAFLADATHCIRTGDVFSFGKEGGRLVEVKSGKGVKDQKQIEREQRQRKRLELRGGLLNESLQGFSAIEAGTGKSYWALAESMLRAAGTGPKLRTVEPGLRYAAVSSKDVAKAEKKLGPFYRQRKYLIGHLSRRVNEMAIVEPFPLYLSPAIARKVISGRLELITLIDFDLVRSELAKIGVEPVMQGATLTHFRSTAGDAFIDSHLLDTAGHACRSLADVLECYRQLMAAHRNPQTAETKGMRIGPQLMERLALLDMKVPEEMKRAMAKMKATGELDGSAGPDEQKK